MVFPCTAVPTRTNSLALTGLRSSSPVRTNLISIILIQPLIMDRRRPTSRPSLIWPVRDHSRAQMMREPPPPARRSIKNLLVLSIQVWIVAPHLAPIRRRKSSDDRALKTQENRTPLSKSGDCWNTPNCASNYAGCFMSSSSLERKKRLQD